MGQFKPQLKDVTVIGHFSIDSILLPSRPHPIIVLGGAVTYVSLMSKRLDATTSIISRVGTDFPEAYVWWLKEEGIDLSGITRAETDHTTRFELQYSTDLSERVLKLKSKAQPISANIVPGSVRARAIHLAPIIGEISTELARFLKDRTEILSLDAQGMLRCIDSAGNIVDGNSLFDPRILELINVLKCSKEEISLLTGKPDLASSIRAVHDFGAETVIVTMGAKGALLSVDETIYEIPTYPSRAVVDPTGAGDAFMGGFLVEFIRAKDPLWCACMGSAASSTVIEGVGPMYLGEKEEIHRRAETIFKTCK